MTENITENRHRLNTIESGNIQTDVLGEIKSKVVISDKSERSIPNNIKKMISKNVQVDFKEELPEGGIVFDLKYEMYWQELAESKRIELEDALEENERLCKLKETLIKENIHYQKLLEEASSFVEVLKDVVKESPDDTGIDVRDVNDSIDAKESVDGNDSFDGVDSIEGDDSIGAIGGIDANDVIDANGSINANGPIDANGPVAANGPNEAVKADDAKNSKDE